VEFIHLGFVFFLLQSKFLRLRFLDLLIALSSVKELAEEFGERSSGNYSAILAIIAISKFLDKFLDQIEDFEQTDVSPEEMIELFDCLFD